MTSPTTLPPLRASLLTDDPLELFARWFEEARELSRMEYPNAMTLSTVTPEGMPDGRIVLLKELDARGFTFYTNYRSAKGRALAQHPKAALTFYWDDLARQVRIRGPVERVSSEESEAYFRTRPRGSRIGACVSDQSRPLGGREALEARYRAMEARLEGGEIPRPDHWGGYRLLPAEMEFWQAGANRLHDRFLYRRNGDHWAVERLAP